MTVLVLDRVRETTETIGTGSVTLDGAVTGYQSFAGVGNGNTTYFFIQHRTTGEWEVSYGIYSTIGPTLSRTTVLASSNGNALVDFSAGTKDVVLDVPAYLVSRLLDGTRGQIVITNSGGTWTVSSGSVTDNQLRPSAPLSVIGRSEGTSGNVADITATSGAGVGVLVYDPSLERVRFASPGGSGSWLLDFNAGGDPLFLRLPLSILHGGTQSALIPPAQGSLFSWDTTNSGAAFLTPVSGLVITGSLLGVSFNSGVIQSGNIASGSVQGFFGTTRNIASGTVGVFDLGSGAVVAGTVGSGAIRSGNIASGQIGINHLQSGLNGSGLVLSGQIGSGQLAHPHFGSGAVLSGDIASGQIGINHLQSGLNGSGLVLSGQIGSGQVSQFHLSSGAVNSGQVSSGVVLGQLGGGAFTIASGTIGTNDLGSGSIVSGLIASGVIGLNHVGSGAIRSGHISSGQIGNNHLSSGSVLSGRIASGQIGNNHLADDSVLSGHIASGQISRFHLASGLVPIRSGFIASGAVLGELGGGAFTIASGTIGPNDLGSGSIRSGLIASGQIGINHLASGSVLSGRVASGQIGNNHLANSSVFSGHLASGQISQFALASGAANSGHIASGAVPWPSIQATTSGKALLGRKTDSAGTQEQFLTTDALDFVSGPAQGTVLFRGATQWQNLAPTSSGRFLQTQGTGANPIFATAPGRLLSQTILNTSGTGTYTTPAGVTSLIVEMIGGGGGGGGVTGAASETAGGGGGGAGAFGRITITPPDPTYSYVVGGGGLGGAAGANPGISGIATVFGSLTVNGGGGANSMATGTSLLIQFAARGGDLPTGFDLANAGQAGTPGIRLSSTNAAGGTGGGTIYGTGGPGRNAGTPLAGDNATGAGAGGGGACTASNVNRSGGRGTDGLILVWEFA